MSDFESMAREAHANPVHIKSRSEYIDYYRDTYGKAGTRKAAESLYGSVKNKKGEDVSVKNIMRQFQSRGGKEQKESAKSAEVYQEAGKKLPPTSYTPKQNTITVTVNTVQTGGQYRRDSHGNSKWVSGGERPRSFTATFSGPDAYAFVNNPSLRDVLKKMGYSDKTIDLFEEGEYKLNVTSVS